GVIAGELWQHSIGGRPFHGLLDAANEPFQFHQRHGLSVNRKTSVFTLLRQRKSANRSMAPASCGMAAALARKASSSCLALGIARCSALSRSLALICSGVASVRIFFCPAARDVASSS